MYAADGSLTLGPSAMECFFRTGQAAGTVAVGDAPPGSVASAIQ